MNAPLASEQHNVLVTDDNSVKILSAAARDAGLALQSDVITNGNTIKTAGKIDRLYAYVAAVNFGTLHADA